MTAAAYPHIGQRVECIHDFSSYVGRARKIGFEVPVLRAKYHIRDFADVSHTSRAVDGEIYFFLVELVNPVLACDCCGAAEPAWCASHFRPIGGTEEGMKTLDRVRRDAELRRLGMDILDPVK